MAIETHPTFLSTGEPARMASLLIKPPDPNPTSIPRAAPQKAEQEPQELQPARWPRVFPSL
jgi:hypothetical protein